MEMTCKQMPKVLGQYQQGYYSKVKILFKASLHLRPFRKTARLVFDFNRLSSKGSTKESRVGRKGFHVHMPWGKKNDFKRVGSEN